MLFIVVKRVEAIFHGQTQSQIAIAVISESRRGRVDPLSFLILIRSRMISSKLIQFGRQCLRRPLPIPFQRVGKNGLLSLQVVPLRYASTADTAKTEEETGRVIVKRCCVLFAHNACRNEEQEQEVKEFLRLINTCNYRKYYVASFRVDNA